MNFKTLLSRLWQVVGNLDTRVKNSAILSAFLGVVLGLALGIPDCFRDDPGPEPPEPSTRTDYALFLPQFACLEEKQNDIEYETAIQIPKAGILGTPAERVKTYRLLADYARSSRRNSNDMAELLAGIRPPKQFTTEHQELVDYARYKQKLIDDLEGVLPPNLNLTDAQILSDPTLEQRYMKVAESALTLNRAINRRNFSFDFASLYVCVTLTPRPTLTRVPIVIPTFTLPTIAIPVVTPSGPLATIIAGLATVPPRTVTPTPRPFGTPTPIVLDIRPPTPSANPFAVLTPVR